MLCVFVCALRSRRLSLYVLGVFVGASIALGVFLVGLGAHLARPSSRARARAARALCSAVRSRRFSSYYLRVGRCPPPFTFFYIFVAFSRVLPALCIFLNRFYAFSSVRAYRSRRFSGRSGQRPPPNDQNVPPLTNQTFR